MMNPFRSREAGDLSPRSKAVAFSGGSTASAKPWYLRKSSAWAWTISSRAFAVVSSTSNSWPVALATSQPCRAVSMSSIAPTSAAGVASPMTLRSPSQAWGADQAVTALSICRA